VTCREIYETGVKFMQDYGYRKDEPAESWMEGGHFDHGYASGFDWLMFPVASAVPAAGRVHCDAHA